jgi:hypothetical protein
VFDVYNASNQNYADYSYGDVGLEISFRPRDLPRLLLNDGFDLGNPVLGLEHISGVLYVNLKSSFIESQNRDLDAGHAES